MGIVRFMVRSVLGAALAAAGVSHAFAQATCSATITVDGGAQEVLTGPAAGFAVGLHTLGGVRIQSYSWTAQSDASGGYVFNVKAVFKNDNDVVSHTVDVTQTAVLVGGTRPWFSTYRGDIHEEPGPSGTAPDGRTFCNPNHMDSRIGLTTIGNTDLPVDVTPDPVSVPYDSGQMGGTVTDGSVGGTIHLHMTLGRGDVNKMDSTATLETPGPIPIPTLSIPGLVMLLALCGGIGWYVLTTRG